MPVSRRTLITGATAVAAAPATPGPAEPAGGTAEASASKDLSYGAEFSQARLHAVGRH